METFLASASDLDSILDQFEQSEADTTVLLKPEPISKSAVNNFEHPHAARNVNGAYETFYDETSGRSSSSSNQDNGETGHAQTGRPEERSRSEFLLDLSEADFAPEVAPAPPPLLMPTRNPLTSATATPGDLPGDAADGGKPSVRAFDASSLSYMDNAATLNHMQPAVNVPSKQSDPSDSVPHPDSRSEPTNHTSLSSASPYEGTRSRLGDEAPLTLNTPHQQTAKAQPAPADVSSNDNEESSRVETAPTADAPKMILPAGPSNVSMPAPLQPELMHEYVKQGARPKIIPNAKTPDSPAKPASSEGSTVAKPNSKTVPPQAAVVGFGSVATVRVTDADLEALEQEVGIMSAQDKSQPVVVAVAAPLLVNDPPLKPKHLNIEELQNPRDRVSPVSQLLNEQYLKLQQQQRPPQPSSNVGNELVGLDPYYHQSGAVTNSSSGKPPNAPAGSPGATVPTPYVQDGRTHEQKDGPLSNDVITNNVKNLLRNAQPVPGGTHSPLRSTNELLATSGGGQQGLGASPSSGMAMRSPTGQPDVSHRGTDDGQQTGVPATGQQSYSSVNYEQSLPSFLPADPPSYQDVKKAMAGGGGSGGRQGLSLNFDQTKPRKVAQALPPSPIVETVTDRGDDDFASMSGRNARPVDDLTDVQQPSFQAPPVNQNPVLSQPPPIDPPSRRPQVAGDASFQAAAPKPAVGQLSLDTDSMTPSNETDSEEGEFAHRIMDYSEGAMQLGAVAPVWVPDSEALSCMNCEQKFTFRKRRHHCRACGKVFCAKCCSMRLKLKYMESKEARVCISCLNAMLRAQALKRTQAGIPHDMTQSAPQVPSADVPSSQTADQDGQDSGTDSPANSSIAGSRSSLLRPNAEGSRAKSTRKVHFSDGVKPGVEQVEQDGSVPGTGTVSVWPDGDNGSIGRRHDGTGAGRTFVPVLGEGLPPVVIETRELNGDQRLQENPVVDVLLQDLRNESVAPIVFALNKNLLVRVKILNLNCCVNRTCWCFSTQGMATVGQDEIVIVIECLPDEGAVPRDIFTHLQTLYDQASVGVTVSHMGHSILSQSFLGGREHGGFLYLRPSFQCLSKLLLPEPPYLFAVLLQKWETPWAKVFPLRLMLRLGAEFRYYPCPLMSVRFRKPVFGEIGHTIMNLLADFKNYQYKLPVIPGITIHMQDRETVIKMPRNRYDQVMKVVNNSNEHVMAIAANFSPEADSHLVCIQNDEGTYHTQAISIQNKPRKVTGASFVVFNGALKTTSGLTAKSSIVEDGLMIQILPETMIGLRQSLRKMVDLPIQCGSTNSEQPDETITVKWVDDDKAVNLGIISPIDARSLEGVESIRIHNNTDYHGRQHSIRWTEVFFLENSESQVDLSRLAEMFCRAFCGALTGQLHELQQAGMVKLALRVTVDVDKVGYEAGSKGDLLPPIYMNQLDNELIPVLHNAISQHDGGPVVMELHFYIINQ